MKTFSLMILGASLLAATGFANAAGQLAPVQVQDTAVDCTPPTGNAVCTAWHEEIRRNFTSREIGMLFGARTAYANYNANYDRVKARYDSLQATFAANLNANLKVASK